MDIHVEVKGERQVGLKFEEFFGDDGLYADLKAEIEGLTSELRGLVEGAAPELTGKLKGEIAERVFADKTRIKGEVIVAARGPEAAKAAALEYGAHRATKVKAHSMRLDHAWNAKLSAPETVLVAAYTRTPDIEEHRFERGPLAQMQPEILERLNAAVDRAAARANA